MVLPPRPRLVFLLISHCTAADILDVSQLMNQLCIKFRADAIGALDTSLLPFLQKCYCLSSSVVDTSSNGMSQGEMDAPHLRTEQLSIQKLSFSVLQHIVVHRATAILLSPTNISGLETILQTLSNGAITAEDPVMKKSCLVFFRELLDQWVAEADGTYKGRSFVVPPDYVIQGFVRFFCDVLVPGMLDVFFSKNSSFNVDDANHFRCLAEFSGMLEILKNRLPDVYSREVLDTKLSIQIGVSQPMVEAFRSANTRKEFEACFKAIIPPKGPQL
jgi:exportin-T